MPTQQQSCVTLWPNLFEYDSCKQQFASEKIEGNCVKGGGAAKDEVKPWDRSCARNHWMQRPCGHLWWNMCAPRVIATGVIACARTSSDLIACKQAKYRQQSLDLNWVAGHASFIFMPFFVMLAMWFNPRGLTGNLYQRCKFSPQHVSPCGKQVR